MTEDAQLGAIGHLHDLLGRLGIPYWIFGGWAVDFHAGRVTRDHADIDMAVWFSDLERVKGALHQEHWEVAVDSLEYGYLELHHGPMRLDLTFLARNETTGEVYTPLPEGRGSWAEGAFGDDVAELEGVRARVVRLDSLISDKSEDRSDPVTAMKDRADLDVLNSLHRGG
jgi:Aminoglycoside-2''-adenylyltransferase